MPNNLKSHKILLQEFKDWLDLLGFVDGTVYKLPIMVKEFLNYLENKGLSIEEATITDIADYYRYLKVRSNNRGNGGGLSNKTLNQHQWALKKFKEFVFKHYKVIIPLHLKIEKVTNNGVKYLTIDEVKQLFLATESVTRKEALKQRYRAILVLLYSCGLRRSEAMDLNTENVLFERHLIVVQDGKNSKQRYVPINSFNLGLLQDYMLDARMELNRNNSNALLLGQYGTRLSSGTIGLQIQQLVKATNNVEIIEKNVTAHTLRHSIATHLLEQGMNIEDISQFLGHSSLESTQIYTHILQDDEL